MAPSLGLDSALRALLAHQQAIDVVAHNIANASTSGYSRQTIAFMPTEPYTLPTLTTGTTVGQVGTGVTVSAIRRIRDTFLDYQLRNQQQALGEWEIERDVFQQVEVLFNEPSDTGIGNAISEFWDAWQELSNNPEDGAVRASLLEQSENLVALLQGNYQQLADLRTDTARQMSLKVAEINSIATQIAELNVQISRVELSGQAANDYRDERDNLLDQLFTLAKVSYLEEDNGALTVFLGGQILVQNSSAAALQVGATTQDDETLAQIQWASNSAAATVTGGQLKGLLDARNQILPDQIDDLQVLTGRLISDINGIHATGYNLNDETGVAFFTGTGADDIDINAVIRANVRAIAAGAAADAPGDGSIALRIAQLKHTPPAGEESTIDTVYQQLIARLGIETRHADIMCNNQNRLVEHLTQRKEATSGVSLDEETVNLIKYQHVYEAAAKVISVIDEMLDIIVNELGIIG